MSDETLQARRRRKDTEAFFNAVSIFDVVGFACALWCVAAIGAALSVREGWLGEIAGWLSGVVR